MHSAVEKYSEENEKCFELGTCEREDREKYFHLQASAWFFLPADLAYGCFKSRGFLPHLILSSGIAI